MTKRKGKKTLSAKASEHRRVKNRAEEARASGIGKKKKGAAVAAGGGGGVAAAQGGNVSDGFSSTVLRFIEECNLPQALNVARNAASQNLTLDLSAVIALLIACVRSGSCEDAAGLMGYIAETRVRIPLRDYARAIFSLSQRISPPRAAALLAAAEPCIIGFASPAARGYFFHFSRLIVDEYLTDAATACQRISQTSPYEAGIKGLALIDVRGSANFQGTMIALTDNLGNVPVFATGIREIDKGDVLLLSPMRPIGRILSGSGAGAGAGAGMGLPRMGSEGYLAVGAGMGQPRMGSEGYLAVNTGGGDLINPFISSGTTDIEVEILSLYPAFTCKVLSLQPFSTIAALLGSGAALRADKLSSRVTFLRQLEALTALCSETAANQADNALRNVDPAVLDSGVQTLGVDAHVRAVLCPPYGASVAALCAEGVSCRGLSVSEWASAAGVHAASSGDGRLNDSQRDAVRTALTQRFTLVLGPPGTGKTATAVALIGAWLRAGVGPILATADSNTAVDNLLDGLARVGNGSAFEIVRVGRGAAVRTDLARYSLDSIAPLDTPRDEVLRLQRAALKRAAVVCATASGAGSAILQSLSFGGVLVDEASQSTEPAILVALAAGAPRVVALFGDNRQLPPTISSRIAEAGGLGVSLFDRLARAGAATHLLDTQYRMHPALAVFPSRAFYNGALRSGTLASARPPPRGFLWPNTHIGLAFINVEGAESVDGTSRYNLGEVNVVTQVVRELLQGGELKPSDIGVISPYSAQVKLLRRALSSFRGQGGLDGGLGGGMNLPIDSVDGFQGREMEVIVFSAVRSNTRGSLGFLEDPRRMNVMLTRAKRGLIVIGHAATLRTEANHWGPWLNWAQEGGVICGGGPPTIEGAKALAALDTDAGASVPPRPPQYFSSTDTANTSVTATAITIARSLPVVVSPPNNTAIPPVPRRSRWDMPATAYPIRPSSGLLSVPIGTFKQYP